MQELNGEPLLEVCIRADGKVVWINTVAGCVFRASDVGRVKVIDERKKYHHG